MGAPADPAGPDRAAAGVRAAALLAVALAAAAAVLWPALWGELVYDDLLLVAQNPALSYPAALWRALGAPYWDFLLPEDARQIGYWRPLTALALYAGRVVGGGEPWGFHAVSLFLHLAGTSAAFLLARRLARSVEVGFWSALLFALHPVQVEAVAWISAVNDPLHGALTLFALAAFLRWRERGSPGAPAAAALLFALALLAKENALAFVPLALAIDVGRVPREVSPGERAGRPFAANLSPFARAWIPFALVLAAWWAARAAVFGSWTGGFERVTTQLAVPLSREITLRVELLGGFLGLAAWPASLNLFREVRLEASGRELWLAALWILAWGGLGAWLLRRRARPALAAVLFLPAGVLPALVRLESLGRFPLSERFLYVPVFGVALLAALGATRFLPRAPAWALLAVLAAAAGAKSRERTSFWRDEPTLFREAAEASPKSPYVRWGLGRVLLEEFRRTRDFATLEEAQRAFLESQELGGRDQPEIFYTLEDRLQANLGLGWYFLLCAISGAPAECLPEEAELVFRETAKLFPDSEEARTGIGAALLAQGRLAEAEEVLRQAIEIDPRHQPAWFHLGQLELRRGRWREAAEAFESSLQIRPGDVDAMSWLGTALAEAGEGERALALLGRAAETAPSDPHPRLRLASALAAEGRFERALEWVEGALRLDGRLGEAHLLRGKLLLQMGQTARAVASLEEAVRWMPGSFEANYDLGVLYLQGGMEREGAALLERALALDPEHELAGEIRRALEEIAEEGTEQGD